MSGKRNGKLVGLAVILLILCGVGWLIFLRPGENTDEFAKELFQKYKSDFATTAQYLVDKNIETDILGFRTIDNNYGVHGDDSMEFRAFADSLSKLQNNGIETVHSHNGMVLFRTFNDGGVWVSKYTELKYVSDTMTPVSEQSLPEKQWYYSINDSDTK